ncbi:MAG: hypothetical protein JWO13_1667 [Acidobacteriales bacterium]|nr:hypothetical protein [Terriglobales bacterium]
MVLDILDYYRGLLWSPQPLYATGAVIQAALALLIPALITCWIAAILITRAFLDRRAELTTFVRARLGWTWAGVMGILLILSHITVLAYLQRVLAVSAVLPYYSAASVLALLTAVQFFSLRRELKTWQRRVS